MEKSLTLVVKEFEKGRKRIGDAAKQELVQVKQVVVDLGTRLSKKTVEMRHIKRLSQHILDQRTEMEEFFMESLEMVRKEVKKERLRDHAQAMDRYHLSMKSVIFVSM